MEQPPGLIEHTDGSDREIDTVSVGIDGIGLNQQGLKSIACRQFSLVYFLLINIVLTHICCGLMIKTLLRYPITRPKYFSSPITEPFLTLSSLADSLETNRKQVLNMLIHNLAKSL